MTQSIQSTAAAPDHIDLALSGGGFRAALFHLGLIGFLQSKGLLSKIRNICSVSGGSVLAAYLVAHWAEFNGHTDEFQMRASKFVTWIGTRDVSGYVLKGSFSRLLRFKPLDSEILVKEYDEVLRRPGSDESFRWDDRPIGDVTPPKLHILATHLNTGRVGAFSMTGFNIPLPGAGDRYADEINALITFAKKANIGSQAVARSVAASSAFPPLFSPVSLVQDNKDHLLTDGGVYDNSGVNYLTELYRQNDWNGRDNRLVIVSDAGRAFATKMSQAYGTMFELASRVIDAQGNRIAYADTVAAKHFFEERDVCMVQVSIHDAIKDFKRKPTIHTQSVEDLLRAIRTELDRFSPEEAFSLYRHGYLSTQQRYLNNEEEWGGVDWTPADALRGQGGRSPTLLTKNELEQNLTNGHIVRKWREAFKRVLWLAGTAVLIISLFVFWVGYFFRGSGNQKPDGALKVTDIADLSLARAERKPFVENAVIKTGFHFPVDVPIETMATLFFECDPPTKEPKVEGRTLKVQVLVPKLVKATKIKIRPRTAPSTPDAKAASHVYSWNSRRTDPVRDEFPTRSFNAGYEEFSADVDPDGAVVIISYYEESCFKASTLEDFPPTLRTGWIHVEVSDYASERWPDYLFAVGAAQSSRIELDAFEVWPGDNQPWFVASRSASFFGGKQFANEWPGKCKDAQKAVLEFLLKNANTWSAFENGIRKLLDHFARGDDWTCVGQHVRFAQYDMAYIVKRSAP